MRYFWSIPTQEDEKAFYSDYAKFAGSLTWLILVCQIISGLTEAVIFFSIGTDTFQNFGTITANIMGFLLAVFGVFMIEIFGLRFMLPQAARQFLYKRFQGMHLAMTIFICAVTAVLTIASLWLSLDGGGHAVVSQVDKVENKKELTIHAKHQTRLNETSTVFDTDSSEIIQRYTALEQAAIEKHNANLGAANAELDTWTQKRGNYSTRIRKALTKIETIKADKAKEIADLSSKKAIEQKTLRDSYKIAKDSLQGVLTAELDANSQTYDETEATFSWATWIAVIVAILLSIVCIIIKSIYEKGSGQKEIPIPTDYDFRQGAMVEAWGAWGERIQTQVRNRIATYEDKTPQPKISKRLAPIYNRAGLSESSIVSLEVEQVDDDARTVQLSVPSVEKKSRTIGFGMTGSSSKEKIKAEKRNDSVTGDGSAKFGTNRTLRTDSIGTDKRICDNCGTDIQHKRSDARFCSTPCRKKWHSKNHGGNEYDEYYKIR